MHRNLRQQQRELLTKIRLNLKATPQWHTLAPGMRLPVGPLTKALKSTARAEMAIETLPQTTGTEKLAAAIAKAVARRAILNGTMWTMKTAASSPLRPMASTFFRKSGPYPIYSRPNTSPKA